MSHLKTYRNCGEHHSTYEILDIKKFLKMHCAKCSSLNNGKSQIFKYDHLDYFKNPELVILTVDSVGNSCLEIQAGEFQIDNFPVSELLCKNKYRRV
jgi:hypothetical protein